MGGETFGNGQATLHRARLTQDLQHLLKRHGGGEGELGGAQRALSAGEPGRRGEGPRIGDDAPLRQRLGDALRAAARDDHLRRLGKRAGIRIGAPGRRRAQPAGNQQHQEEDEQEEAKAHASSGGP